MLSQSCGSNTSRHPLIRRVSRRDTQSCLSCTTAPPTYLPGPVLAAGFPAPPTGCLPTSPERLSSTTNCPIGRVAPPSRRVTLAPACTHRASLPGTGVVTRRPVARATRLAIREYVRGAASPRRHGPASFGQERPRRGLRSQKAGCRRSRCARVRAAIRADARHCLKSPSAVHSVKIYMSPKIFAGRWTHSTESSFGRARIALQSFSPNSDGVQHLVDHHDSSNAFARNFLLNLI